MTEEERKKLAELRNKKQKEKEFLADIGKDLHLKDQKRKLEEIRGQYENPYVSKVILFFGTIGPMYVLFYLVSYIYDLIFGTAMELMGISFGWLNPVVHGLIWLSGIISLYRDRSVLEDIVDRFF